MKSPAIVIKVLGIPQAGFSSRLEGSLSPGKSGRILTSLQKLSKFLLIPASCQGFSIPNSGPRISHLQQSKFLNLQQRSWIYFPRQQSNISLSPIIKDLFSSARQLIILHAHTLHSYIINIDKTRFIASYISCNITLFFS